MTQLAGGELLSLDILTQGASMAFPYGLRNTTQIIECHTMQHFRSPPANDEFVGMANYVEESIHDLLANDLESISDSASSQGSYHPSCECFKANIVDDPHHEATLEGHVMSANDGAPHGGNGTPLHLADGRGATADAEVPPYPRMNQLRERQQELKTT
jgi:hypothetical protein